MKLVSDPVTGPIHRGSASASALEVLGEWHVGPVAARGEFTELCYARPRHVPDHQGADYLLKRLRACYQDDPLAIGLLRREAEVARSVRHPHVVSVLDARLDQPPCFLVVPRLEGSSLDRAIQHCGGIALPQALWIVRQVAEGLQALHQAGWIHADVKPANIVVSRQGHATLIDLGCALGPRESVIAWDRPIVGTLAYMAPEMTTSRYTADARCDIYSLGITLYQMLSGRLPFSSSDLAQQVAAHRHEQPKDLTQIADGIPAEVAGLVRRMLAKEPLRRPHSAAELVEALIQLEIDTLDMRVGGQDSLPGS